MSKLFATVTVALLASSSAVFGQSSNTSQPSPPGMVTPPAISTGSGTGPQALRAPIATA